MNGVRNTSPISRVWWWLLPASGFFAYPDITTRWERARWAVPYGLWRIVNRLPFSPFKPMVVPRCTCELCAPVSDTTTGEPQP